MIYFIRCEQNTSNIRVGNIKVGTTKRLSQRLPQIANDLGHTPKVLGVMDGSFAEERALHEKFADYRSTGEWFEPSMDMAGLIDAEARPWDGVDEAPITTRAVRLDDEVVAMAKKLVALREIDLGEYLTSILKPYVDAAWKEEMSRMAKEYEESPEK